MKRPEAIGSGVMARILVAFALSLTLRCPAEPADDADFSMRQADARKSKFLSSKDPGPFVIRRLTKVEYSNTLHDLNWRADYRICCGQPCPMLNCQRWPIVENSTSRPY